jgi:hypothetical protein
VVHANIGGRYPLNRFSKLTVLLSGDMTVPKLELHALSPNMVMRHCSHIPFRGRFSIKTKILDTPTPPGTPAFIFMDGFHCFSKSSKEDLSWKF